MRIKKRFTTLLMVVIVVGLGFTNTYQYVPARISTSIYLNFKHKNKHFKFQSFQYERFFGEYSITYKDENGKVVSFMMTPKAFPIVIMYDPLIGE